MTSWNVLLLIQAIISSVVVLLVVPDAFRQPIVSAVLRKEATGLSSRVHTSRAEPLWGMTRWRSCLPPLLEAVVEDD